MKLSLTVTISLNTHLLHLVCDTQSVLLWMESDASLRYNTSCLGPPLYDNASLVPRDCVGGVNNGNEY